MEKKRLMFLKAQILIILVTVINYNSIAQIKFEHGYFIDNNGQKTNCLIKNYDWKDNPTEITYKILENSEPVTATLLSIEEFGVTDAIKYYRRTINIDRSSDHVSKLSKARNPEFKNEQIFLKVLVEGKANLFMYTDGYLTRFFFSIDGSKIEQLVYKKYLSDKYEEKIGINEAYKQQLLNNLKCENIPSKNITNLSYNKKNLVDLFVEYNKCQNTEFSILKESENRKLFNFNVRPGMVNSSLSIKNSTAETRNANFGNKFGFRFGLETEFILPYNKSKWSITIEPTYQYFKADKEITIVQTSTYSDVTGVFVDYKSIEFPFGIRYYSFLNKNSKLFLNVVYIIDLPISSTIYAERKELLDFEINSRPNFGIGLGYMYKKIGIELRYSFSRELLNDRILWSSNYKYLSAIIVFKV